MNATLDVHTKIDALWRRGCLDYLRHDGQVALTKMVRASKAKKKVINCSRRWGKDYWCVTDACEVAIREPGVPLLYTTATQKDCRDIVEPLFDQILDDCPGALLPKFNSQRLIWDWPNGSRIELRGLDGMNLQRRRGGTSRRIYVSEAAFVAMLRYAVESVLMPRTLTTNGDIIMVSTPPKNLIHEFRDYAIEAQANGAYAKYTIFDAPHITHEQALAYIEEAGGLESTVARREYLGEFVVEESDAVIPEFQRNKADLVVDLPIPEYRHYWVAADFGFSDMTVVVFAYLDFQRARIVVEDELAFQGVSGIEVGNAIKAKELALWGADARPTRIADAPAQLLADLASVCGVAFGPARKDDADAALNGLRMDCHRKILAVHPRCKVTISHLENAIWNTSRTSFARSEGLGHFDGVDAVKYLCRHIDRHANPFPPLYGINPATQNIPERLLAEHRARSLAGAFGR